MVPTLRCQMSSKRNRQAECQCGRSSRFEFNKDRSLAVACSQFLRAILRGSFICRPARNTPQDCSIVVGIAWNHILCLNDERLSSTAKSRVSSSPWPWTVSSASRSSKGPSQHSPRLSSASRQYDESGASGCWKLHFSSRSSRKST